MDCDRQAFFKISEEEDLIRMIKGWEGSQLIKFDFFSCSKKSTGDKSKEDHGAFLLIHTIPDSILYQTWESSLYLSHHDNNSSSAFKNTMNWSYDD